MAKYRLHTTLPDDVGERFQRFSAVYPGRAIWYVIEMLLDAADGKARSFRHGTSGAVNAHRTAEGADAALHSALLSLAEELHRCGDTARAQRLRGSVGELAETLAVRARATASVERAMNGQPAAGPDR